MNPEARVKRQCVFLAYRKIFVRKLARIRKRKAICTIVQKNDWLSYQKCVGISEIDDVVRILRILLTKRIFESEELASKEFPNLEAPQNGQVVKRDEARNVVGEGLIEIKQEEASNGAETIPHNDTIALQLPRFPFNTQHRILSIIQRLLEESCFRFTEKWLPFVLERYGWTCAAAGELTKWLSILKKHINDLPHDCLGTEGQASFKSITPTVAQLRHTVVHRLHLTLDQFLDQIRCARTLGEILKDVENISKLQALHVQVELHAREMRQNQETMQREVDSALLQIQWEREALIQREQRLQSYVMRQKTNIPAAAGRSLDESINVLLATRKLGIVEDEHIMSRHNENAMDNNYGVIVEEGDIESDEDRLRLELD
ncbi:hypothetical protein BU23DRAFT_259166 [Bimuria novae-zelandiae CBS 107.79]|uniref:Ubiquinol-cytochrome-c reductase cytochrome c1 n=1 Tax=Bimuria novae-zelandiae CBS 107.79 TaxID=1447943 RepID=A0A6A5V0Z7_9PLEO|nr:hypothetical protein BU23DRAFT_259166 [Bimuria novae-zelandiae CBS 107.79]